MKNAIYLLLLFFSLQSARAATLEGKVLSIHDGDTLTVQITSESKKSKVRFMGVDTPEIEFNGKTQGLVAQSAEFPIWVPVDFLKGDRPKLLLVS